MSHSFAARPSSIAMLVISAALVSSAACGGGAPVERAATHPPENTAPPPVAPTDDHPLATPTPEEPAPTPPPSPPNPSAAHARAGLGTEIVALVENATQVDVGHMAVGGALQAEQQTLRANSTLVGYRIRGALKTLSADQARALSALLLDEASYSAEMARCANTSWVGARFGGGAGVVEFGLGLPCNQATWAANPQGTVVRWGSNMTPAATTAIQAIINAP